MGELIVVLAQNSKLETVGFGGVGAAIVLAILKILNVLGKRRAEIDLHAHLGGNENAQNDQVPAVCVFHDGLAKDVAEIKTDVKKVMFHLMGDKA